MDCSIETIKARRAAFETVLQMLEKESTYFQNRIDFSVRMQRASGAQEKFVHAGWAMAHTEARGKVEGMMLLVKVEMELCDNAIALELEHLEIANGTNY